MDDKEYGQSENTVSGSMRNKVSGGKKKAIWGVVSVLIAALTVWAVMSQSKSFSFKSFLAQIGNASQIWIAFAILSMVAFIAFEAIAILTILRNFGHGQRVYRGLVYSSADIYFSAITPSATGGQPASAYFMHQDGISTTLAAVVLMANLLMYTCSTVGVGVLSTLIFPSAITHFNTVSKLLVIIGFVVQVALLMLIYLLIAKEKIIQSIGNGLIGFFAKIRIFKDPDAKKQKLAHSMQEYKSHVALLGGKRKMMAKVFMFNIFQRVSQILVTVFTYIALGNPIGNAHKVFSLQTYTSIGAYCIPIPGSMGITDYLMIDGFKNILPEDKVVSFELLSRTISFYSCILICGVIVLISYLIRKNRRTEK